MGNVLQALGIIVAAIVSMVGAYISIRNRKSQTKSLEAKTNLDEAQQAAIVKKLADSTEEMYLRRIESFKDDIRLLRQELLATREELNETRDEAALFEDFFFNHHQPWDRRLVQMAQDNGWEIENPPSWLMFLRNKGMKPIEAPKGSDQNG